MRRAEYNDLALKKLPIRKLFAGLAIGLSFVVFVIGGLSLPWHASRPALPPVVLSASRGSGPLRAGVAAVNIDLPAGVPIGGFARRDWTSQGLRDPVSARAVYLDEPGCRVAVASAEILLVTEPLERRVEALVADLGLDAVLVTATHTHAGPGGYSDDFAFERVALGPYDARVLDLLADRIATAIRQAVGAAAPARLSVARGLATELVRARSGGQAAGRLLSLRLATPEGAPLAELLVFAAHPTTLGKANHRISGDWPGRFAAAPGRGVRLVLQGALGDQSARVPPGDDGSGPERYAAALRGVDDALPEGPPLTDVNLAAATAATTLPAPAPGAVPAWLRRAASTLAWSRLPASARVTALRLGPVLLVAVPAEPTAEVGERWRRAAGDDAEIASLFDGYAGYVETPERTRSGVGETVRTYYGPDLAPRLEDAIVAAVRATR
jgi:hypothetical protein